VTDVPSLAGAPVGHEHISQLSALLRATPRTPSEYTLANLYLYRKRHAYRLVNGESPFLLGRTYDGALHALPLCPLDEAVAMRMLEGVDCIYPLAEEEVRSLSVDGRFLFDDREADGDYLYDANRLARLAGAKAKRAQAAAFELQEPRVQPFEAEAARAVLAGWLDDAGRGGDHADAHECAEAIASCDELGLSGRVVYLADDPVAFLLAGPPRGEDRVVHFAKGRHRHAGAYPWMFAHFAAKCGTPLLNFEQDLGHAGLAQAKRALGPVAKVRKYRLRSC
jgi:uncharacterized protein